MEDNEVRMPKNSLEVLRWVVFEPVLLEEYSGTVKGWKPRLRALICSLCWIAVGCFLIYSLCLLFIAGLDLPRIFPDAFIEEIIQVWNLSFKDNLIFLFEESIFGFYLGMAFGLVAGLARGLGSAGLASGLVRGLTASLLFSLASGIAFGLVGGLAGGFAGGSALGIASGLARGLTSGAESGWAFSLAGGLVMSFILGFSFGLVGGTTGGIAGGLADGMVGGLSYLFAWFFFYYRTWLVIPYFLLGFSRNYTLEKNPHIWDGVVFIPLPGLQFALQQEAYYSPKKGYRFSHFLFRWRKLQGRLAWYIGLAALAGEWRINRCISSALKAFPKIEKEDVWFEDKSLFINLSRQLIPLPTSDWQPQIEATRLALLNVEHESNARLRVQYFKAFREELDKLYDLALRQPHTWGQYFVKALELWQKTADTKLRDLELEAAAEEPIVPNIYRGGEKLRPEDRDLFLGREDLRDAFKKRVVTATSMPLFFIQGQRRVGKSSLIAFLPSILDSGFRVVAFDMQEHPGTPLPTLLQKIRERIHETLRIPPAENEEDAPGNIPADTPWIEAWHVFRQDLERIAGGLDAKIVLAIDEYEELHRILKTDPLQGGQLLAAMRSWSQSQNRVVFLFAGSEFFTDLREPNWGEYFVQAERLYVDYLGHDDSLKLINLAGLHYPPELLERMYQDTQGHPCWLQVLCREIVTMVNKTGRTSREVTEADYEAALNRILTDRDDQVMRSFWRQFCENHHLKDTVRQILNGETPTDDRALLMLEDHRFIVREGMSWRMRAPMMEAWLRRYQVT